jgi:integral membrane protein
MAAERTETSRTTGRGSEQAVGAALQRYRFMANVVGVLLIALIVVAVPLKYFAGNPGPVAVIGTAHGLLYGVYLLAAFDLALRARWRASSTLGVLLAGTVPLLSFVAERIVTRRTRAGQRV